MTIAQLGGALSLIAMIGGGAVSGVFYIDGQVAAADERARSYSDAAYRGAKQAHAVDYWRAQVQQQARYLDHLRASQAAPHVIRDAESEQEYYRSELRQALKTLSDEGP